MSEFIVVDSSVWIDFFRGRDQAVVSEMGRLLDDGQVALASPIRLELLTGAARGEVRRLRRLLSALPIFVPSAGLWSKLESWVEVARDAGERFAAMDLVIAGVAHEEGSAIWSRDQDFERMARLGFCTTHRQRT